MAASVPVRLRPLIVTVLAVPTLRVSNIPAAVMPMLSPVMKPLDVPPDKVAVVVPSNILSFAVIAEIVTSFAVIVPVTVFSVRM